MSENVVPLNGAAIQSDERAEFMRQVGAAYDEYVSTQGEPPEALVYTYLRLHGSASTGWRVTGDAMNAATTVLSFAMASVTRQAIRWGQD